MRHNDRQGVPSQNHVARDVQLPDVRLCLLGPLPATSPVVCITLHAKRRHAPNQGPVCHSCRPPFAPFSCSLMTRAGASGGRPVGHILLAEQSRQ